MNWLTRLRAWAAGAGNPRPTTSPTAPPLDQHITGASLTPWTNPSSGLVHVNTVVGDAGGFRGVSDLDKPESSRYARPGRHNVAFSLSRSVGDDVVLGPVTFNGTRTVIAARPSAPTRIPVPSRAPERAPWIVRDQRTAPFGTGNVGGGMQSFGTLAVRTQQREVPPTDAASQGAVRGEW